MIATFIKLLVHHKIEPHGQMISHGNTRSDVNDESFKDNYELFPQKILAAK